ncbi:unnamed protein product [Tuwongella immobilis]|uniref:Uncharacterized protein n=1 Tax=Tuwongella immobilis TaxID=692036 RepID=A0A6C2YTK3_9BACT|nr:unnamed protein product [Tuwongella immobilis]VTS06847.1 unnamed protein product [Tuwongella immobilis]
MSADVSRLQSAGREITAAVSAGQGIVSVTAGRDILSSITALRHRFLDGSRRRWIEVGNDRMDDLVSIGRFLP